MLLRLIVVPGRARGLAAGLSVEDLRDAQAPRRLPGLRVEGVVVVGAGLERHGRPHLRRAAGAEGGGLVFQINSIQNTCTLLTLIYKTCFCIQLELHGPCLLSRTLTHS